MRNDPTARLPSRLRGALTAAVLAALCAAGWAGAQPRPADLELDLLYLIRDLQALEDAAPDARAALAREVAAFEERLEAAPGADARLWAGLDWLHRQLGRAEEADGAWRRARSAGYRGPRPESAAAVFRPPGGRKPGVVGRVTVGAASDSNPSLLGEDLTSPEGLPNAGDTFPVLAGETPIRADEEDGLTLGSLRLAFHPGSPGSAWTPAVEVAGRATMHQDLDPLDRTEARAALHLARGGDPAGFVTGPLGSTRVPRGNGRFGLLLQLGAARDLLDGETHVTSLDGAAALLFRTGQHASTRLEVRRSALDLDREGADFLGMPLSGVSWDETAAGAVQSVFLGRQDRVLRLGGSAGERRGDPEVEGAFWSAHAGLDLRFARRWALFLGAELRNDDYDHPESNTFWVAGTDPDALEPRDETTWRASARLVRELPAGLGLVASVLHEDRDAEEALPAFFDPFTYDRTVATLELAWRFGREATP